MTALHASKLYNLSINNAVFKKRQKWRITDLSFTTMVDRLVIKKYPYHIPQTSSVDNMPADGCRYTMAVSQLVTWSTLHSPKSYDELTGG